MMDQDELDRRFTYHPPNGEGQILLYQSVRDIAREFAIFVDSMSPDCDEKAEAIKKVEEAVFWANAAIARCGAASAAMLAQIEADQAND